MFRESESRVTMETRIQVQLCQEYRICSCESYTMSQTDTANSNQWRAVTFFHCHIPLDVASVVTSPFVCLSRQTPHSAESWGKKKFYIPLAATNFSRGLCHNFKLFVRKSVWVRVGVCISPTAAPGLHLIRPLFHSCPNRQAL